MGPGEALVGIEIIDAKRVLGESQLPRLFVENLSVAAA